MDDTPPLHEHFSSSRCFFDDHDKGKSADKPIDGITREGSESFSQFCVSSNSSTGLTRDDLRDILHNFLFPTPSKSSTSTPNNSVGAPMDTSNSGVDLDSEAPKSASNVVDVDQSLDQDALDELELLTNAHGEN